MTSLTNPSVLPSATSNDKVAASRPQPLLRIRPPRGWAALDIRGIWRFRNLLVALALRDVKLRYKQTALGIAWVILQPLLAAGIFSFVFGKVARMPSEGCNYFLFSYAGLLGWNLFSTTLTRSSVCLIGNSQLITKIFFPRLVLPLSTIPSALIDFAVALLMMLAMMAIDRIPVGPDILLLPFWALLLLILSAGIGIWTAALTVSYRDVQYILPVLTQLWLYISPVAYSVSAIPQKLRWAYDVNPLAPVLAGFRCSLLGTQPPSWPGLGYAAVVSVAFLIAGALIFKRMERRFADVI